MKKKLTTILAMLLCAIITITGVCTETAYAAEDTTIKVTFKKKSVTYSVSEDGIERVNLKTLKKKWGKPSDTYEYYGTYGYTWKKGKTEITYKDDTNTPERSALIVSIEDKNGSLCGVKVGMTKAKAKKIFKKMGCEVSIHENIYMTATLNDRIIFSCTLENGKVVNVGAALYAEDVSK